VHVLLFEVSHFNHYEKSGHVIRPTVLSGRDGTVYRKKELQRMAREHSRQSATIDGIGRQGTISIILGGLVMRTRGAFVTVMPALLAVVCMQSSNTEAQDNTEARLSAAVNAAAPLTFNLSKETTEAQAAETLAYWTPERLATAQPMLPLANQKAVAPEASAQASGTSVSLPGKRPTVAVGADAAARLYDPAQVKVQAETGIEPQAVGSFGAHFTSGRVNQPALETIYPNRMVGKLFFTDIVTGVNYVCSASVLRFRIVLTAGHCVHKGSGGNAGYYTNFVFVPAFRDGTAPLGRFTARFAGTTFQWFTSSGAAPPNAADFGMLEMNDRDGVRIGSITGFFGFRTLGLIPNHTTKLGYPCNIDACQKMQQVTSQSFRAVSPNNVEYGSNAKGGSSGGPWVQNYGVQGTGGLTTGLNQVVGVTSYAYPSTSLDLQGSSIPDSRPGGFISLLNGMCGRRAGNC
jgi:V8-like Glu-specific endopeptidase